MSYDQQYDNDQHQDPLNPETFVPGRKIPVTEFTPDLQMRMIRRAKGINEPEENRQDAAPTVPEGKVMVDESQYNDLQKTVEVLNDPSVLNAVTQSLFGADQNESSQNQQQFNQNTQNNQGNQNNFNQTSGQNNNAADQNMNNQGQTNDGNSQKNDQNASPFNFDALFGNTEDNSQNQNQMNDKPGTSDNQNQNNNQPTQQNQQNQNLQQGRQTQNLNNQQINSRSPQPNADPSDMIQRVQSAFRDKLKNKALESGYSPKKVYNFMEQLTEDDLVTLAKRYHGDDKPRSLANTGSSPKQVRTNQSALGGRRVDPNKFEI